MKPTAKCPLTFLWIAWSRYALKTMPATYDKGNARQRQIKQRTFGVIYNTPWFFVFGWVCVRMVWRMGRLASEKPNAYLICFYVLTFCVFISCTLHFDTMKLWTSAPVLLAWLNACIFYTLWISSLFFLVCCVYFFLFCWWRLVGRQLDKWYICIRLYTHFSVYFAHTDTQQESEVKKVCSVRTDVLCIPNDARAATLHWTEP